MKRSALLMTVCLLPLPVLAQEVSIETAAGSVGVPMAPEAVVALDLAAIDTLAALGVTLDGVPAFNPPAPAMDAVETVGSLFEPDFEALAVLGPDLIVAGGRSQRVVEPLSEIAPTIDMTIWGADMLGQARARMTAYG